MTKVATLIICEILVIFGQKITTRGQDYAQM